MNDLLQVKRTLEAELGPIRFAFVNTRLILRTGVDLTKVSRPDDLADRMENVIDVLQSMGVLKGDEHA